MKKTKKQIKVHPLLNFYNKLEDPIDTECSFQEKVPETKDAESNPNIANDYVENITSWRKGWRLISKFRINFYEGSSKRTWEISDIINQFPKDDIMEKKCCFIYRWHISRNNKKYLGRIHQWGERFCPW